MIDDSEMPVGDLGEKKGTAMIKQKEDIWTAGTRDAVLQILGNIVNRSAAAQNKMREVGGIELVLNHTKMHPKHPLQREWALFTVFVFVCHLLSVDSKSVLWKRGESAIHQRI